MFCLQLHHTHDNQDITVYKGVAGIHAYTSSISIYYVREAEKWCFYFVLSKQCHAIPVCRSVSVVCISSWPCQEFKSYIACLLAE